MPAAVHSVSAHAVSDDVRPVELKRIEQRNHGLGKERRVVGAQERLVGVAEAREVDCDRAVIGRQRANRREERRLGGAETVEHDHGVAGAGLDRRQAAGAGVDVADAEATVTGLLGGGDEEPDAEMEVAPDPQATRAVRGHPAAHVPRDGVPGHLGGSPGNLVGFVTDRRSSSEAASRYLLSSPTILDMKRLRFHNDRRHRFSPLQGEV